MQARGVGYPCPPLPLRSKVSWARGYPPQLRSRVLKADNGSFQRLYLGEVGNYPTGHI